MTSNWFIGLLAAAGIVIGFIALNHQTETGPQGPVGPVGPQGPVGMTGPQGPVGMTGSRGSDGLNGRSGTDAAPTFGQVGSQYTTLQNFYGDLTVGSNRIASSTSASVTLSGSEFRNAGILDYTINAPLAGVTLTLPASTTAMCSTLIPNERRTVYIRHATTTAATILTLAGGTGFSLKKIATSTTSILNGDTDGNSMVKLELLRKSSGGDCIAMATFLQD